MFPPWQASISRFNDSTFFHNLLRFFRLFFHTYIAVPFILSNNFLKITSQNLIIKLMMEQVGTKILSSQKITESRLYFSLDLIFYYSIFNFGSVRNSEQLCVLKNWTINSKIRITIFMLHSTIARYIWNYFLLKWKIWVKSIEYDSF
jgi:hypothetical protein